MQHVSFQAILPIYKFPKVIRGPDIDERGPRDGHFLPSEYLRCQDLITRVEKIEMSMTWKDQVTINYKEPFFIIEVALANKNFAFLGLREQKRTHLASITPPQKRSEL